MNNSDAVIKIEGVSKRYRIGLKEQTEDSLVRSVLNVIKSPVQNYKKYKSLYDFDGEGDEHGADILWALRDVSFEVEAGQVLGIIGSNGAGKSTLLKILSRITPPTGGKIEMRGRTSSLLEVGTGFHPELTGRENVYLNGTILGLRKREVDRLFDQIVEFSGIEKFLDTPVKRYSSGMRIRLGFAVAAHLEPEILIIDEVLAVGDAEFQRKCLSKMEDVGRSGRTVLFVSHSMPAVSRMCERVVWLKDGRVHMDGNTHEVISTYLRQQRRSKAEVSWERDDSAPGGKVAKLRAVRLRSEAGDTLDTLDIRDPIGIEMVYDVLEPGCVLMPSFALWNEEGVNVCVALDQDERWRGRPRPAGRYISTGWVPGNLLAEGLMTVNTTLWVMEPRREMEYHVKDAVSFQVVDSLEGDSARGDWQGNLPGVIRPKLQWTTEIEMPDERLPAARTQ